MSGDISHWNRRSKQKHLIELALSDSWGVAGVSDPSGRTPMMVSLGALPSNHDVLLARFQIPAGLDVDKPSRNIGKFLTSADYAYGRILPRGEEHGSNLYDMVLAETQPVPHHGQRGLGFRPPVETTHVPVGRGRYGQTGLLEHEGHVPSAHQRKIRNR